jgi:hypothetical protein
MNRLKIQAPLIAGSLVVACVAGFLTVRQWRQGQVSADWPAVEGTVTRREAGGRRGRRGRMPRGWVLHVDYAVDGQTHQGVFNHYEAGETITVYYDPSNPANAVTTRGVDGVWFAGCALAAVVGVLGTLGGSALVLWPGLASPAD